MSYTENLNPSLIAVRPTVLNILQSYGAFGFGAAVTIAAHICTPILLSSPLLHADGTIGLWRILGAATFIFSGLYLAMAFQTQCRESIQNWAFGMMSVGATFMIVALDAFTDRTIGVVALAMIPGMLVFPLTLVARTLFDG